MGGDGAGRGGAGGKESAVVVRLVELSRGRLLRDNVRAVGIVRRRRRREESANVLHRACSTKGGGANEPWRAFP